MTHTTIDEAPLDALRSAFVAAAAVVRSATDEAQAMVALIALDDALTASGGLLDELPDLIGRARPGPSVESWLRSTAGRLAALTAEVSTTTSTVERMRRDEAAVRQRAAELETLRAEVAELRRLERLVAALDALREHRDAVGARVAALRERAGRIDEELAAGDADLRRLSEAELSGLREPTRAAVEEAEAAHRRLAAEEQRLSAARSDLAAAEERRAGTVAEREERLAAVRAHAEADRAVARAIADAPDPVDSDGLSRVRATVDEIVERLAAVDTSLRDALAAGERRLAQTHAVLGWSADPPR